MSSQHLVVHRSIQETLPIQHHKHTENKQTQQKPLGPRTKHQNNNNEKVK